MACVSSRRHSYAGGLLKSSSITHQGNLPPSAGWWAHDRGILRHPDEEPTAGLACAELGFTLHVEVHGTY